MSGLNRCTIWSCYLVRLLKQAIFPIVSFHARYLHSTLQRSKILIQSEKTTAAAFRPFI